MSTARTIIATIIAVLSLVHGGLASSALPEKSLVEGVPFTQQMPNYCGPASLSSLLAYWKTECDQQEIASAVYSERISATVAGDLLLYCRDRGMSAYSFNGKLTDIKRFISQGCPVIVLQNVSRTESTGHFRVAIGYDDHGKTITLRDSLQPDLIKQSYSEFDHLWSKRARWAMLAMPKERDDLAKDLPERNTVLHLDLAQAYLKRGDFAEAETESREALRIEPRNHYALDFLRRAKAKDPARSQ